jgi:hypothetical protein
MLAAWRGAEGNADCSSLTRCEDIPDFKTALSCRSFLEPVGDGNSLVPEPQYDAIMAGKELSHVPCHCGRRFRSGRPDHPGHCSTPRSMPR